MGSRRGRLLGVWARIEINILFFLFFLVGGAPGGAAGLQYLIIQRASSIVILVTFLLNTGEGDTGLMVIALLLKVGGAPCHFWFFSVIRKIRWDRFLWLSTVQKVLPVYMFSLSGLRPAYARLSALVGGLGGLSRKSLKQMLGYSSLLTFR